MLGAKAPIIHLQAIAETMFRFTNIIMFYACRRRGRHRHTVGTGSQHAA
jgi:hypothetical protein